MLEMRQSQMLRHRMEFAWLHVRQRRFRQCARISVLKFQGEVKMIGERCKNLLIKQAVRDKMTRQQILQVRKKVTEIGFVSRMLIFNTVYLRLKRRMAANRLDEEYVRLNYF